MGKNISLFMTSLLLIKNLDSRCFPMNFVKFFRTPVKSCFWINVTGKFGDTNWSRRWREKVTYSYPKMGHLNSKV